jgi:hypothetical protein
MKHIFTLTNKIINKTSFNVYQNQLINITKKSNGI